MYPHASAVLICYVRSGFYERFANTLSLSLGVDSDGLSEDDFVGRGAKTIVHGEHVTRCDIA
jgi:hypothetical protein